MDFYKFLLSRILTFILVVFIGITAVFFVPRFLPSDPVEAMIGQMTSKSAFLDPKAVETLRETLNESFGLQGSVLSQYLGFFKRVLLTQDFGPSLANYPAPVNELIGRALPWTMGLLLTSTVISWLIGNAIGLLAGFRKEKPYSKALEAISIALYPIPYYIFALVLIMLFSYIFPVFPLTATFQGAGFTWEHIRSLIINSTLPALSMILVGTGWWVISMKTISSGIAEEDYVHFARLKGVKERKIMSRYVLPNAALPQVTMLALQLGAIFNGALVTEILFGYPGVGTLIYNSILQADYNLIMGTITLSIIAVAGATFVVDFLYPFLDPRVRYK
ncbi:peptide/nickel transport system permease protein [Paenibacillus rhizosphaerae]|uniref:Peptide/nickel transport system permease protein n=1 Tax=Paenibacillus rhizosphaerae TaxID=297318 RepID=A0A839TNL8_9BACL|nr:ABC transporter permease [Paenibacillus rhizosphaerae]MBB3128514.1 peptide/nickel transport system permease protein [Paenibacillus rhizosphaerae]